MSPSEAFLLIVSLVGFVVGVTLLWIGISNWLLARRRTREASARTEFDGED